MTDLTYLDSGFDQFFQRELVASPSQSGNDVSQFDFESQYLGLSASQIATGIMQSSDGRLQVNLDDGYFFVSDGTQERVRQGKLPDGSYGLLIKDKDGNEIMNVSGDTNKIQSSTKKMILDFIAENLSIYNESNIKVVKLGNLG